MRNLWTAAGESRFSAASGLPEPLAHRLYTAALLGRERALVLHGGGNVSLKELGRNAFGEEIPVLRVKASGFDLAVLDPEAGTGAPTYSAGAAGLVEADLVALRLARRFPSLTDEQTFELFARSRLRSDDPAPSLEALVHAWLPHAFVDHTHPEAVLLLSNLKGGEELLREAVGRDVIVIPYADPGLPLAHEAIAAFEKNPDAKGMIWRHHGLVTWGESARESYEATIDIVTRVEKALSRLPAGNRQVKDPVPLETAWERIDLQAPILRGLLARPSGDPDRPHRRVILRPLVSREALDLLSGDEGKKIALSWPLTSDHVVRVGPAPCLAGDGRMTDAGEIRDSLRDGIEDYASRVYRRFLGDHEGDPAFPSPDDPSLDPKPRVVFIEGVGALCSGRDALRAQAACDLTAQRLQVETRASSIAAREGLSPEHLFRMEFHRFQRRKAGAESAPLPLAGEIALVTGAAGAIGSGICEALLAAGAHVAATDLAAGPLAKLAGEFASRYPGRVLGVPMDVTDPSSVRQAVQAVIREWGGVDLGIVNAGIAHVAPLAELDLEKFRQLERVNVEGTLLVIQELARIFSLQGTGGDIVLVSTKNVFSPGAGFGAYSATKAAAHQLARIASLELAAADVRVNMVAPDAVFSHGAVRSGLWQEVGPGRMKARGLDEKGLEEYYRGRNLLKTRVTAAHVARAVLFFATRQTPTTGATIPVDGGLPDATPR
jgi:rhamnose utilization protein RhaD (predicted bifunctional aldolase and dehydrogenase)/NAD(P)-dependent dehydrogenase (short-subunit alcohol dehydrogenase family)